MAERLVVIGGDAGGMSAASQARRLRPDPDDLEIVAFERGRYTSYSACGIPYLLGGLIERPEQLVVRRPEQFRERGIDARVGHEVVEIELDRRRVRVRQQPTGHEEWHGFDSLVVATGAVPVRPPLPGADGEGIHGVQTLDDGIAVLAALADRSPQRAVVVGGGYIGLEVAEAFVRRGLHVTVVEQAPQPMGTLDPDMGAMVADGLRRLGVDLRLGDAVTEFALHHGRVSAVITEAATVPTDLVVLGLGVRPATELAQAAGIPRGESGAVAVDDHMQTRREGVWAAGDCVESQHRVSGEAVNVALGTHANKQGRVAGTNIGGGEARFPGVLGTAASKVCGLEVARTGLTEQAAAAAGFAWASTVVRSTTRAGYYPGALPITTKVIFDRRSGRLLGAQIVGEEGAAKRIDVFAAALWNDMTVDDLAWVDLSYAPPFSPVWDPVLLAARKAAEERGG